MAAEAAVRLLVTDMIRVGIPPDFHLREDVDRIDVAQRCTGGCNLLSLLGRDFGIVLLVELAEFRGETLACRLVRFVFLLDNP